MDFSEYKGIYVTAVLKDGHLQRVTGELLGAARMLAEKLGHDVAAVLLGHHVKGAAADLISLGADKVYVIDSPLLAHYDGKAYQKALAGFLKDAKPDIVMFDATSIGRDLAPRVAAELVCGVTADVTELSVDDKTGLVVWSRPAMGGNIMADIISPNYRPQVGTVRPGTFPFPERDESRSGDVIEVAVKLEKNDLGTLLKEVILERIDENPVEEAEIIVAGGRGIKSREEWELVRQLAQLLGAAVGCSRPIAELGWEDKARQIGQTGKGVNPRVYIALGISGAMQHMCGVNADVLIAVNKDKSAPIMEAADYAVEADLKVFLPALIKQISGLKAAK
ncbi:MAG: electron transfer flavoprotein subunit alpha/FixB family protein [Dialister sp.]|nr:electron transfer flavoprotein subunit alpha/FixB family protein [Dialister sp.]